MTKSRLRRPLNSVEKAAKKPFISSKEPRVQERDINLVEGKSKKKSGGDVERQYWHIYCGDQRVGRVFIDWIATESREGDAAITVEINSKFRGRGVGTIVFRRACELSRYDEVFADIRKSNIASRIAAERAGFEELENKKGSGIKMVWHRK